MTLLGGADPTSCAALGGELRTAGRMLLAAVEDHPVSALMDQVGHALQAHAEELTALASASRRLTEQAHHQDPEEVDRASHRLRSRLGKSRAMLLRVIESSSVALAEVARAGSRQ